MKSTQAWGWLAAGLLAAGLNAAYHDGGLEWAHRIVDRAQHVSNAVVALASGRADQFVAEAQTLGVRNSDEVTALSDNAVAEAEQQMARAEAVYARAAAFSGREQARCGRIERERARIQSRIADRRVCIRARAVKIDTAMFRTIQIPELPKISIPRIDIQE